MTENVSSDFEVKHFQHKFFNIEIMYLIAYFLNSSYFSNKVLLVRLLRCPLCPTGLCVHTVHLIISNRHGNLFVNRPMTPALWLQGDLSLFVRKYSIHTAQATSAASVHDWNYNDSFKNKRQTALQFFLFFKHPKD